MYYAALKACDIANGPGVRVTLFVSGCTHHCPGCFQPETWDFTYGQPFTQATQEEVLRLLSPAYIRGLTLLGGEPFEPDNRQALLPLIRAVRAEYPEKSIWAYSGYTFERLSSGSPPPAETVSGLLSLLDVLVDGPFVEAQRDLTLRFLGSSNQRLIDLQKTKEAGHIVLWDDGR